LAAEAPDAGGRVAFPRGKRAGTCLHAILERIDFAAAPAEIQGAVSESVAFYGFDADCVADGCDLIARTLHTPLDPGVTLAGLSPGKRLVEFEFMLPVKRLNVDALRTLLSDPDNGLDPALRQAAHGLDFATVRGFVKGFIDLVFEADGLFYLIDYKSNHLGGDAASYERAQLAQSVAHEHYYLQYLLYCVAIRRYFSGRGVDFDARFAGVRYLYMRGLDADGRGIWRDQPSLRLLDRLDGLFAGEG
jgi:exodeoxyribonuclease V beta subunit